MCRTHCEPRCQLGTEVADPIREDVKKTSALLPIVASEFDLSDYSAMTLPNEAWVARVYRSCSRLRGVSASSGIDYFGPLHLNFNTDMAGMNNSSPSQLVLQSVLEGVLAPHEEKNRRRATLSAHTAVPEQFVD